MDISAHTVSLQQTLKGVEAKLEFLGSGAHSSQKADELKKLTNVKQNLMQQIQASVKGTQQVNPISTTSQIQPQLTQMMAAPVLTSVPKAPQLVQKPVQPQQVILTKPRPAVPQFLSQIPMESDSKILNKQRLQELVKEIDPTEQLDEDVEEMLMQITDDFIEKVVSASCQLARHRQSTTLEAKDIKLHLERHWNISIPGFGSDEIKAFKKPATADAHKQRLALIRKATKK